MSFTYERDSNVFEKIDTEEKAYWLGFLYADGYVNEENHFLTLGIGDKDKEHIEKFRKFLKTDAPYKDKINNGGHPFRYFRIYDQKIVADLAKQGCTQGKSLVLTPSCDMDESLWVHWSRGVFDGDGSIYAHTSPRAAERYYMGLCGTEDILYAVQMIWGVHRKLDYNRSVPKFTICKKTEVNEVLHLLYDNATIYLDRKYKLAYKAIEQNLR